MSAQPLLHELMGIPKYLLDEHVDLVADDVELPWRPAYLDDEIEGYYVNDAPCHPAPNVL